MHFLLIFQLIWFSIFSKGQIVTEPTGTWYTPEKESQIEIKKNKGVYTGRIVWLEQPNDKNGRPVRDLRNSDASLRNRPIMGLDVLSVTFARSGEYTGKVYDAKTGRTYDVTIITSETQLEIRVQVGLIRHRENWTRVNGK